MLSLVNAATVAFDVVRLPNGAEAADVLLAALQVGPDELAVLDRVARSRADVDSAMIAADRRQSRLALERGGPVPVAEALADLAAELASSATAQLTGGTNETAGTAGVPPAVRAVATTSLCRGTDLAGLLTDDVLGWTRAAVGHHTVRLWPHAVEALLDALLAAVAGPVLTPQQHERLTAPLLHAELPPGTGDLGPNAAEVTSLVALAAGLDPDHAAEISDRHHAEPGWAEAMHRACWAVYLSGRIRPAAAAQFALARTVARRPDHLRLASDGAFTALTGAVHAEMVADLLDDASRARLLAPFPG